MNLSQPKAWMILPAACVAAGLLWVATGILPARAIAEEDARPPVTLSDDPDKAWEEVQEAAAVLRPPEFEGQPTFAEIQAFQERMQKGVGVLADKAGAFATKFPDHPQAAAARQLRVQALGAAVNFGDAAREKELEDLVDAMVADRSLPEDERVGAYLVKHSLPMLKEMREAGGTVGPDFQAKMQQRMTVVLLDAAREFPGNETVYAQLLMLARNLEGDEAKEVARQIIALEDAPASARQTARAILEGKQAYEIGKPLDIAFTAVDGREVDLVKMKGKVVLIDFWAVWCGPCVAEIPKLKELYAKYNDQGFEIIGISFDNDKQTLLDFVEEREIPWPHHFDGKGWGNAYGVKYGINSIPRVWLVDREGNLVDVNARTNTEQKVQKLLAGESVAAAVVTSMAQRSARAGDLGARLDEAFRRNGKFPERLDALGDDDVAAFASAYRYRGHAVSNSSATEPIAVEPFNQGAFVIFADGHFEFVRDRKQYDTIRSKFHGD